MSAVLCEPRRCSLLRYTRTISTHAEVIKNGQAEQLHDFSDLCVENHLVDSFSAAKAVQNTYLGQANAKDSLLICEGCLIECTLFDAL